MMKCKRCGNEEIKYFFKDQETWYCRKCVAFGRVDVGEDIPIKKYKKNILTCEYTLQYPLTPSQARVVKEIAHHQRKNQDVLIYAACGAGKTELVMDSIQRYLNAGLKVGFAISRRQVVLEIRERMEKAFPMLEVIAVCEGFTEVIDADLIICTMHQLYRYHQSFDLLIMDEVDAFPYRNNEMLEQIAMNACIGRILYLTATPDEVMLEKVKNKELQMVELFQRPHGYPLIVPQIKHTLPILQDYYLWKFIQENKKAKTQVLFFVPTIAQANSYYQKLRWFYKCHTFTSKSEEKEKIIDDFHKQAYDFLICTTILERGITIKGINIVILHADHLVFNEASLIQMIGRVGRNIEKPTGTGLFLCTQITKDIKRCVSALEKMNASSEEVVENATVRLHKRKEKV